LGIESVSRITSEAGS
ncbi:hypothetical protein CP02DC14_0195B, partial [Chlamydia psittaci 02DC14]